MPPLEDHSHDLPHVPLYQEVDITSLRVLNDMERELAAQHLNSTARVAGMPDLTASTEIHEAIEAMPDPVEPTPEQMAEELGCLVNDLPEVLSSRINELSEQMAQFANKFKKPQLNRKQRRDLKYRRHRG